LSKVLPLEEYGYFSLIVMICSGLIVISVPIRRAIQPKVSILFLSKKIDASIEIYRKASHLITIIVGAIVITICIYSEPIILFWTNDYTTSLWVSERLYLFIIGAGLLTIQAILLSLQESSGDLNLQIKLSLIFFIIQIPVMLFCVLFFGIIFKKPVIGIGLAWLGIRIISFLVTTSLIHKTYNTHLNKLWFFKDFFPVILLQTLVGLLLHKSISSELLASLDNPIFIIIFSGFILISSGIFSSHYTHSYIISRIRR
jgi:O-antigen/teichoic acid export membrane protein